MLNTIKFNCQLSSIIIAVLSAIMMTSCIYEDDDSYIGQETKLARFIISVGNEQGGTTRTTKQTTEVTQAQSTPVFRGMQDMVLIPFRISGDEVTTSSRRLAINITLPAIGSIPQVSANNTINSLMHSCVTARPQVKTTWPMAVSIMPVWNMAMWLA